MVARKPKSLVANLIVKDEEHIIRRCLESVKPWISSWCIVDTGSTDRTMDIVREVLADIPGELHQRPWVSFSHNRTEAIELARPLGEWILLMDADHMLDEDIDFGDLGAEGVDHYYVPINNWSDTYQIIRVVKADVPWFFEGATHETIHSPVHPVVSGLLQSVTITEYGDGSRRLSGRKGPEDIELLEADLKRDPNNPRTIFYLAQSYFDAHRIPEAFDMYAKRAHMQGYPEEQFWSLFRIGLIHQNARKDWANAMSAFMMAYQCKPTRAEPLVVIASHYNDIGYHDAARIFAEKAMGMKVNPTDFMFVVPDCYGGAIAKEEYRRAVEGGVQQQTMSEAAE